jgi:hypothetical protein
LGGAGVAATGFLLAAEAFLVADVAVPDGFLSDMLEMIEIETKTDLKNIYKTLVYEKKYLKEMYTVELTRRLISCCLNQFCLFLGSPYFLLVFSKSICSLIEEWCILKISFLLN